MWAWLAQAGGQSVRGWGSGRERGVTCLPAQASVDPAQHLSPALHCGPAARLWPSDSQASCAPQGTSCSLPSTFLRWDAFLTRHHLWASVSTGKLISWHPCIPPPLCPSSLAHGTPGTGASSDTQDSRLPRPFAQLCPLSQVLCISHTPACYTFL